MRFASPLLFLPLLAVALPAADAARAQPTVLYDRSLDRELTPFPDDFWLVDDPSTGSGKRIDFQPFDFPGLLGGVVDGIVAALAQFDGYSATQPIVLGLSEAPDPTTAPTTPDASLLSSASIALFDTDPQSPDFGSRFPFKLIVRSDPATDGTVDHTLILLPSASLRAPGHYTVVVTRDLESQGGVPFAPSAFFSEVLSDTAGGSPELLRVRSLLAPSLDLFENQLSPPLPRSELALAVPFSTRSEFFDPSDWVSVKEQVLAAPPPTLNVESTTPFGSETVVRGTITLPLFVDPGLTQVTRNVITGAPVSLATEDVPFVFRFPTDPPAPVPILIAQHGSPGSPETVVGTANSTVVSETGFAAIGIQDLQNRRFGESRENLTNSLILSLVLVGNLPLDNFQTNADMMGLLRAIQGMGSPVSFPQIDASRIVYRGASFGAHHSIGFLAFSPEVKAAVAHVGSGRLFHTFIHQLDAFGLLDRVLEALTGSRPRDVVVGFAALQVAQDRDDPILLARHLYRERLPIAGLAPSAPTSLLWTEGLADFQIPQSATRAAAVEFGIPSMLPIPGPSPVLDVVSGPLRDNIEPGVTAGHTQFDPLATPSCVSRGITDGHFCGASSDEVLRQAIVFLESALAGSPVIVDMLSGGLDSDGDFVGDG
ncbi:MAG: hypothetical protein QNK05_25315, partial [Myxococcota bacterium]|nr:hypothetical protein [Myxococcota bacterium]